jgi:hypothetical protein
MRIDNVNHRQAIVLAAQYGAALSKAAREPATKQRALNASIAGSPVRVRAGHRDAIA